MNITFKYHNMMVIYFVSNKYNVFSFEIMNNIRIIKNKIFKK